MIGLIDHTMIGDDIDMIVNLIDQLYDNLPNDAEYIGSVKIPRPDDHQKWWTEIDLRMLGELLQEKYQKAPRIDIPDEFLTSY